MNIVLSGPGRGVARFRGIGLHGGKPCSVTVVSRPAGHGIVFRRTDLRTASRLVAKPSLANCGSLSTRLMSGAVPYASTVEHLMAALSGSGIWDADVLLDGPEVPIMDGSSAPFLKGLAAGGFSSAPHPRAIQIQDRIRVEAGEAWMEAEPSGAPLGLDVTVEFPGLGRMAGTFDGGEASILSSTAHARTFAYEADLQAIRSRGLAAGGSLENAVVLSPAGVPFNPEGFRGDDEPLRHKALDILGDLALLGAPLMARVRAHRPGHQLSNMLARAILDSSVPSCRRAVG